MKGSYAPPNDRLTRRDAILASGSASLASDTVCDPRGCISASKLAIKIYHALNGKVVGYVIGVGGWFPYSGGWARTAADPPKTAIGGHASY